MSYISSIGTAVPAFEHQQSDIQKFMVGISEGDKTEKRRLSLMYARSGISKRYSTIPDYSVPIENRTFFPKTHNLEPFPSLEKRMDLFHENATELAKEAVFNTINQSELDTITHIITVSCTGLSAPGLDVSLIKTLGLKTDIVRTSVNFMGCYAAIHAIKQAHAFCNTDANARVMVVLVELCTLHFQKENTIDFITSNLLFGDGAACCIVENNSSGLKIDSFYSKLYLEEEESMAWNLSSNGFLMSLKNEVPHLVEDNMAEFVYSALAKNNQNIDEITTWAIHPGGKSILEACQKSLEISKNDLEVSYDVLRNYGNMSSATLVFILKEVLAKKEEGNTFVAGFGPGITMESMILNYKK